MMERLFKRYTKPELGSYTTCTSNEQIGNENIFQGSFFYDSAQSLFCTLWLHGPCIYELLTVFSCYTNSSLFILFTCFTSRYLMLKLLLFLLVEEDC